jgi:uncharacterized protein
MTASKIVAVLLAILSLASAHEGCCKHKLAAQIAEEFIVDPNDTTPPNVFEGVQRLIPDPNAVKPDNWDEEDDGPWEPGLIVNPDFAWQPRMMRNPNYIPKVDFWIKLAGDVNEAVPWVTLGVILVAALNIVPLPLDRLRHELSGGGPFSFLKAGLIGLATPLCSCGSLPIAASLVANGVPLSSAVAFLTASQSAGLDSAAITWGLLGPTAALSRLIGALALAVAAGAAIPSNKSKRAKAMAPKPQSESSTSNPMIRLATVLVETATDIFPLVLLGLAVSAAVVHYLPMLTTPFNTMQSQKQIGPLLLRLGVLISALPLQLCEHTTATLAAGIRKAGGSPGLAFAFLLMAPATNLPSLFLLMQHDRSFAVARVALALVGTACAFSYVIDVAGIDMLVEKEIGGKMTTLPSWYVALSPWLAGFLVIAGLIGKCTATYKQKQQCVCPIGPDSGKKCD